MTSPLHELSERLDAEYYERSPADHFRARASMISAFADGAAAAEAGAFTSEVLARLPEWGADPGEGEGSDAVRLAVTVEAFMLTQHAAESLLRQFLAQLDARPSAPVWFVMSVRDRSFRGRVERLRDKVTDEDLRTLVGWAVVGEPDRAAEEVGAETVAARVEHAVGWLRQAADLHLTAGNGYNAAKHGLSALPSYRHMAFVRSDRETGAPTGRPIELFAGAALLSLESEGTGAERRWFQVARLVDSPGLVAITLVLADLMDSLWQVGRARRLRQPAEVPMMASPSFSDVIAGHVKEWGDIRLPLIRPPRMPSAATDAVLRHLARYSSDDEDETGGDDPDGGTPAD